MKDRATPSRRGYTLAALVVLAGAVGGFAWFNYALIRQSDAVNEFQRIPLRGEVTLEAAGVYTVWAGRPCAGQCRPEPAGEYQEHLTLRFTSVATGDELAIEPFPGRAYYNVGGNREGRAVWLLDVPDPGPLEVVRRSDGEVISPPLLIGRGRGLPVTIRSGVVVVGAAVLVLAGPMVAITYVRRRRAMQRLTEKLRET